jgi:hypothetical protein
MRRSPLRVSEASQGARPVLRFPFAVRTRKSCELPLGLAPVEKRGSSESRGRWPGTADRRIQLRRRSVSCSLARYNATPQSIARRKPAGGACENATRQAVAGRWRFLVRRCRLAGRLRHRACLGGTTSIAAPGGGFRPSRLWTRQLDELGCASTTTQGSGLRTSTRLTPTPISSRGRHSLRMNVRSLAGIVSHAMDYLGATSAALCSIVAFISSHVVTTVAASDS